MNQKPTKLNTFLFVFLFIIYFILISDLITGFFMSWADAKGVPVSNYLIQILDIRSFLGFGLIPILYCLFKHVNIVDSLKLHKLSAKNFMYSILVAILLMPIASAISLVLQFVFPNPIQVTLDEVLKHGFIIAFISIAIFPAIFEELTFRGLFFYKFRYFKPIHIALISSLSFGLIHFNVLQGVYASAMGFCFFYLVYYTNSIFSSMIAHLVINGTNITILYLSKVMLATEQIEQASTTPSIAVTTFYVVLACICSFLLYKLFKKIKAYNKGNFTDLSITQINN